MFFLRQDRLELQDALNECQWDVQEASAKIRATIPKPPPAKKKKFGGSKKHSVKKHEAVEDSEESDSAGEYNDNKVVYDSDDSDAEEKLSDHNLSEDQKRVLKFFSEGTEQELACIQGCSKKKVENIVELRPFEGWTDLVSNFVNEMGVGGGLGSLILFL